MYYSNDVASTSLRLLHDLQPLLPFDDSSKYRMNACVVSQLLARVQQRVEAVGVWG